MKFKVGDIITGKRTSNKVYGVTTDEGSYLVVESDGFYIKVEVISHKHIDYVGRKCWCQPQYFEIYNPSSKESENELNSLLLEELINCNLSSLDEDYTPKFHKNYIEAGCQKISKKDALKLADRIRWAYGE